MTMTKRRWRIAAVAAVLAFALGLVGYPTKPHTETEDFVKTSGPHFTLKGKPFYVTGVNNHYLTSGTEAEVIRVLDDTVAMGGNVVRTYLQPVIGSLDGKVPTVWDWKDKVESSNLGSNGNYLLYWDAAANQMVFNDGPNGIQKLDFLVAEAKKRNLRLIIAFLDFWKFTGGAQQVNAWYGSTDKNKFFFNDPRAKRNYKEWVDHVVFRVNPQTALRYRDDPTIMAWELMNEGNAEPDQLRREWTAEMSIHVKAIDPNHLVGSGHANAQWKGLDITMDMALSTIDFGTWHAYPVYWNLSPDQINDLIPRYCALAQAYQKPVLLEEFGYARKHPEQVAVYTKWLETMTKTPNCAGWLVWRLVSRQDSGNFPQDDHDQFDIRDDGSALWNVMKDAVVKAHEMRSATQ